MNSGPKWSLRNGAQYQRLCARPGCGAAAVATLRFQSTQRQAWLVELDVNASRTQGDLCARHAAALVLPRGWELHDERTKGVWAPVASSDPTGEAAPENGAPTRRKRARRKPKAEPADALPGLEPEAGGTIAPAVVTEPEPESEIVDVEVEVDVEVAVDVEVDDAPAPAPVGNGHAARPVPAQFGTSDEEDVEEELGEILDARTPLLQRAFRNAKPLTEDDDES